MMLNQPTFVFWKLDGEEKYIDQLFTRWENYGQEVFKESQGNFEGINILVLNSKTSSFRIINNSKFVNYIELPTIFRYPLRFLNGINKLRNDFVFSPITLIIGEPVKSGLATLAFRKFVSKRSNIQAQVHGNFFDFYSGTNKILFLMRKKIILFTLNRSESIRVVSEYLKNRLAIELKQSKEILVAPIPVNFEKIPSRHLKSIHKRIAVIGRFHSERGIFESLEIIRQVNLIQPSAHFFFVGSGLLEKELILRIRQESLEGRVQIKNYSTSSQLRDFYSRLDVLISSAPSEGYGLAIREAVLSGAKVVARFSSGVETVAQDFPSEIETYQSIDEAVLKILKLIRESQTHLDMQQIQYLQRTKDAKSLELLVNSWI